MLPFGEKQNYLDFMNEIFHSLENIDLNNLIPTEEEMRFRIATVIQNWMDKKDYSTMNKIIMNLERQSSSAGKIDIVIFYYPKTGNPFAEIIELKRGGKDKLKDLEKRPIERYFTNIREGSIAEDLRKLIFRFVDEEFIERTSSNRDANFDRMPINSGLFILLSPIEKLGKKESSRTFKRTVLHGGINFWESSQGMKIIRDRGKEIIFIHPNEPMANLRAKGQETEEYLEYVLLKSKN